MTVRRADCRSKQSAVLKVWLVVDFLRAERAKKYFWTSYHLLRNSCDLRRHETEQCNELVIHSCVAACACAL